MAEYKRGFYGGKFLPFHKGHKYCIERGAAECEEFVVIFFMHSEDEAAALEKEIVCDRALLDEEDRFRRIEEECRRYPNVRFVTLDCSVMHEKALRDGTDTWDAETEYVMKAVGDFQAVYSSEPGYDDYFKRAYPFARHILVDVPRVHVPISGTKIRGMDTEDAGKWL